MRELWQRLGRLNQVSLVIVAFAVLVGFAAALVAAGPVTGAVLVVLTSALVAFCFWFFFHDEVHNNRLRRRGRAATATILEIAETGVTIQGTNALAKLRLRVEPEAGEPYEVTTKCLVNRFQIPAYQPGNRIAVVVDPDDRTKVAVS